MSKRNHMADFEAAAELIMEEYIENTASNAVLVYSHMKKLQNYTNGKIDLLTAMSMINVWVKNEKS